jgi:hypothetical protein
MSGGLFIGASLGAARLAAFKKNKKALKEIIGYLIFGI